jgi:hypothetical protein
VQAGQRQLRSSPTQAAAAAADFILMFLLWQFSRNLSSSSSSSCNTAYGAHLIPCIWSTSDPFAAAVSPKQWQNKHAMYALLLDAVVY